MRKIILLLTILALNLGAYAQIESPIKWAYAAKRVSATEAIIYLKATIDNGWHIYDLNVKDGGPIKTSFKFAASKDYSLLGKPVQPTPKTKYEKEFGMNVGYFEKQVVFQQRIKIKAIGTTIVKGSLEYATCNAQRCLPAADVNFSIPVISM